MDTSTVGSLNHRHLTAANDSEVDAQFFKTAAQELNNPITTIKTALTLLNSSTLKPQQRQRYLKMIGEACDRQNHLIHNIFELLELQLTPQSTALDTVQLWDLVPGVVSTYQPLATENNLLLAYTLSSQLPPVLANETYLKQALTSLLHNSIQVAKCQGRVWVTAHQRADGKVALVIQDNGRSMSPTATPQVFNSFSRSTTGSGLGLTLVEQLLNHCGASLSVSSLPSEGTTFTILLASDHQHLAIN